MSPGCDGMRSMRDRVIGGGASAREFRAVERHRQECDACDDVFRRADPLGLFRVLRDAPGDEPDWTGLWEAVRAEAHEGVGTGAGRESGLLRPAWGLAAAAGLVVAAGLAAFLGLRPPVAGEGEAALPLVPAEAAVGAAAPPTVEAIRSAEAQVYELKVFADEGQVAQLVMIFDPEIEL